MWDRICIFIGIVIFSPDVYIIHSVAGSEVDGPFFGPVVVDKVEVPPRVSNVWFEYMGGLC